MATFPLRQKRAHQARTSKRLLRIVPVENATDALLDAVPKNGSRYLTIVQLLNRDGHQCYICGEPLRASFEVEHIIARKHGGSDHPLNLALACKPCNVRKRDLVIAFTIADRRPFFLLP